MRKYVKIKKNIGEIKFLIIEDDPLDTKGYFLYYFRDINDDFAYDYWFESLEGAMMQAEYDYKVNKNEWEDFVG